MLSRMRIPSPGIFAMKGLLFAFVAGYISVVAHLEGTVKVPTFSTPLPPWRRERSACTRVAGRTAACGGSGF
jgi:hypothetical protein